MSLNELNKLPISELMKIAEKSFGIVYPKSALRTNIVKELAELISASERAKTPLSLEKMLKEELIAELKEVHNFVPPAKWRKGELVKRVRHFRAGLK
ncbi:MAG: hypothetical protein C0609_01205 [Deltaproteobacteria bacterium]|nr:MAG: hypothetical protein C0609_01205 [Deltaproteobacteria bacterium]